jgi:hypothetical protein
MTLSPSVKPEQFLPPGTAFMARADLTETRLLGFKPINQDAVTTLFSGLLNGIPTVRHRAGVTDAILRTYARAGLQVEEELHAYDTQAEAESLADALIDRGFRLCSAYPMTKGRFSDAAQLVRPDLWQRLNAKENLHQIVPADNLLARRVISLDEVSDAQLNSPIWLKAAGGQATGWGFAVRHCPDRESLTAALNDFRAMPGVTHIIAEASADIDHCWCVSLAINDDSTVFAGFAEQEFSSPGRQSGSVVDPEHPFPILGQRLAIEIGNAARALGFRGMAGLDIGQRADGRLVVFDPNFRFNSSTAQALFHVSATRRAGLGASRSFHRLTSVDCESLIARSLHAIDAGWFVPTRILDGALLPAAGGKSMLTGFVLGADLADTQRRADSLAAVLQS